MIWERSTTLALALHSCSVCLGLGIRLSEGGRPCLCVMRSVFRACFRHFRLCSSLTLCPSRATLGRNRGPQHLAAWGRKNEEYVADFELLVRRTLGASSELYRIYQMFFISGQNWRGCCRRLDLDRGEFFHHVYRLEARVGRACAETEPYALFPVDAYFGGSRVLVSVSTPAAARSRAAARRRPSLASEALAA
jgi:hypothetical protein